jgi:diguanylate cyclase (GGDEF)-like protein
VNKSQQISLDDRVFLKRVELFFGNAGGNVAVAMITAVIASFIMIDAGVGFLTLLIWLSCLVFAVAMVLLTEVRFVEADLTSANVHHWLGVRMTGGALVSLMYGLLVFFLPKDVEPHHVMYVVMILLALTALCATGFAVMPVYTYLISAVTIVPMLIYLLLQASVFYLGLVFTMLIIWGVLINKARLVSVTAIHALEVNEQLIREIDNHKQTRKQLNHMVNHDHLTGLPNRKHLLEQLRKRLQKPSPDEDHFAVLYLDLDGFKNINDQRGHAMGDWLLKAVAEQLRSALPEKHLLARMGGDEFIVLVNHQSDHQPEVDMDQLMATIRTPFKDPLPLPDGEPANIGVSIGAVWATAENRSARAIIQAADQAMYRDKKSRQSP